MTISDADRWDAKYRAASPPRSVNAHPLIRSAAEGCDVGQSWLDVACGWGDDALHAATIGLDVTAVDVSSVATAQLDARASAHNLSVTTFRKDLSTDDPPAGPWDVISCVHYLDRSLFERLALLLAPTGRLVVAIATKTNLERHERPSARFLLDAGELAGLVPSLHVKRCDEAWRENGVHEAWLIAERRTGE